MIVITKFVSTIALWAKWLKFSLELLADILFVVNNPLLEAFYDLFALKLKVQILSENPLSMTASINEEVAIWLYQLLIDYSEIWFTFLKLKAW